MLDVWTGFWTLGPWSFIRDLTGTKVGSDHCFLECLSPQGWDVESQPALGECPQTLTRVWIVIIIPSSRRGPRHPKPEVIWGIFRKVKQPATQHRAQDLSFKSQATSMCARGRRLSQWNMEISKPSGPWAIERARAAGSNLLGVSVSESLTRFLPAFLIRLHSH